MVARGGKMATGYARGLYRSRTTAYHLLCLRFVRECLDIDPRDASANDAWDNADHRVKVGQDLGIIPFGAPVFTDRAGGSEFGHVVLAGGKFSNGARIAWTTDQHGDGRVTPVTFGFLTGVWGHTIKGFTRDLNGVRVPYLTDKKGR